MVRSQAVELFAAGLQFAQPPHLSNKDKNNTYLTVFSNFG